MEVVIPFFLQWMQLRQRRANMLRLFEKMQTFQFDQIGLDSESTLDPSIRALTEEDMTRYDQIM